MRQAIETLRHATRGQGLYEITDTVAGWLEAQGFETGLLTMFCRHTSASLIVTENASPAVRTDIARFFATLAPEDGGYRHAEEGPDDMPAHLKSIVTQTSLAVPVMSGRMVLGTWQGIFLAEHRTRPHRREVVLHCTGV